MIRSIMQEEDFLEEEEVCITTLKPSVTANVAIAQDTDSFDVQTLAQPVNDAQLRKYSIRRLSSAVEKIGISMAQEELRDGGDRSLRPRFLQERSATIEHLTPVSSDPARVPCSKASAFLLHVLSQSKGATTAERGCVTLEPLHGATNTLQYVIPEGTQRGVPLRAFGRNEARRYGQQLSTEPPPKTAPNDTDDKHRISVSQQRMAAVVRGLQSSKQQLPQQLDILHTILRYINSAERGDEGRRPGIKEMVDVGLIPELASIMREFRFHTNLQVCALSILSALAEDSPVYAYMMSEFNLEKFLQKTAVVHASQDGVILLASNLVRAIEESKLTVNISAYRAEKAAKSRRQSTSYTDKLVAAITSKPKYYTPFPSPGRRPPVIQRADGQSHAMVNSAPAANRSKARRDNRVASPSPGRQQQVFEVELAPPALSANYRLLFSQKLKRPETPILQELSSGAVNLCNDPISATGQQLRLDRPASSPLRRSLTLESPSRSLAAAVYSAGSIFIEPSPVLKRLPYRGSFSANGVHRKLGAPKKVRRRNTERLPTPTPAQFLPMDSNLDQSSRIDPIPDQPLLKSKNAESLADPTARLENETVTGTTKTGSKQDEDDAPEGGTEDDESYDDDFDTGGGDSDGEKTMPDRRADSIGSDGELIEMLHTISTENSPPPVSTPTEANAATTIQRHIRGTLARRQYIHTKSTAQEAPPVNRPVSNIKNKKRGFKTGQTNTKRIPRSARAHRQLQSQANQRCGSYSSRTTSPQVVTRIRPQITITSSLTTTKQGGPNRTKPLNQDAVATRQRNHELNNQVVTQNKIPRPECPSPKQMESSKVIHQANQDEDAKVMKEPTDPENLKQIQTLYAEGLQHHKDNHLGLAIDCYDRALLIPGGRDFASLHVNLGSAFMTQNKFLDALSSFEQAKRIQPNNIKAIYNYSLALLHLDRPHEAQQQLRRILELEPCHEKASIALCHLKSTIES